MQVQIKIAFVASLFVAVLLPTKQLQACGACGCSLSNYNPELMVTNGQHSISVLNTTRWFELHTFSDGHNTDGPAGTMLNYKQLQNVTEVRGTYYPHARVAITGVLPITYLSFFVNGRKAETDAGLGDAIINTDVRIVSETDKMKAKNMQHRFSLGAGIKMPTGTFKTIGYAGLLEPRRQNGSGSVDFMFNANYFFRYHDGGFNTFASYKVNTMNKNHYHFGNTFSSEMRGFYIAKARSVSIVPNAGLATETSNRDTWYGFEYYPGTAGTSLSCSVGVDVYYKNFGFTATWFQTLYTTLPGTQLENKLRVQVGVKYVFDKRVKKSR